jgi:2-keto-4-pentenoate hydratase/2-oxohepta-3-ene-1,7-dioic acid hydratase in catechol pathway
VPTVLRVFLTGVNNVTSNFISIRVGSVTITGTSDAVLREPGVYSIDFTLPPQLLGAGDVPIVVIVTANGVTFQSRLDDTAPRFRIL